MKKTTIAFAAGLVISGLLAFTAVATYEAKISTAEVEQLQGVYIFTDCKPVKEYEYKYWKGFASIFGSYGINEDLRLYGQVQFDRKFEENIPTTPTSAITAASAKTDRLFLTFQTEILYYSFVLSDTQL